MIHAYLAILCSPFEAVLILYQQSFHEQKRIEAASDIPKGKFRNKFLTSGYRSIKGRLQIIDQYSKSFVYLFLACLCIRLKEVGVMRSIDSKYATRRFVAT